MKKLYEFIVTKEEVVQVSKPDKDKDGNEITVLTSEKKEVPHSFFIKKPTRALVDEAQLYYSASIADNIRKGLMPRPLLVKKYAEENGIWTDKDKTEYANLYLELIKFNKEIETFKSEKVEQSIIDEKEKNRNAIFTKIQQYENTQNNAFNETAENKANDKTMIWWILNISYNGDGKPFFGDGDLKSKLAVLDLIEENEDGFSLKVIKKFSYLIGFWYIGFAPTHESFKEFDDEFERGANKKSA